MPTATPQSKHRYRNLLKRSVAGEDCESGPALAVAIAVAETPTGITTDAGFTTADRARHVSAIQGRHRAVDLIQHAARETNAETIGRLHSEAEALLVESGMPELDAAGRVERLAQRLAAGQVAMAACQKADEAEQAASRNVQAFGALTARPRLDHLEAIDAHRAAEHAKSAAMRAMRDATRKTLAAIDALLTFDPFGESNAEAIDPPDADLPADLTAANPAHDTAATATIRSEVGAAGVATAVFSGAE